MADFDVDDSDTSSEGSQQSDEERESHREVTVDRRRGIQVRRSLAAASPSPVEEDVVIGNPLADEPPDRESSSTSDEDDDESRRSVILQIVEPPQSEEPPPSDDEEFEFRFLEVEPVFQPEFRDRAKKAVKAAVLQLQALVDAEEEEEVPSCFERCASGLNRFIEKLSPQIMKLFKRERRKDEPSAELSPQLKKASSQGLSMMKSVFFPATPKFLRDFWVFLELAITLFAFLYGLSGVSETLQSNEIFNLVYFVLSVISFIFALIDGFIYFVASGSCAESIQKLCKKPPDDDAEGTAVTSEDSGNKKCCRLNEKWKERFDTWFELGRNLITEILIYPLLICDLFDFIAGGTFQGETGDDKLNLGLFVIGGFYLILSVYFMRFFMVLGSMASLKRMPLDSSGSASDNIAFLVKFCFHVLCQITVHGLIVCVLAVKIRVENPNADGNINASLFLWVAIGLGGILPITGVMTFFLVNYYWMRLFSVSFWIDMMSLLQAESFADTVFAGEGTSASKDKAKAFVEKSGYKEVRKQHKKFKSHTYSVKFLFPLKVPLLVSLGLIYDIILGVFIFSLAFSTDQSTGEIQFIVFDDILFAVVFFITSTFLVVANIQALILLNGGIAIGIVILIMIILASPFILLTLLCCIGICCFQAFGKEEKCPDDDADEPILTTPL